MRCEIERRILRLERIEERPKTKYIPLIDMAEYPDASKTDRREASSLPGYSPYFFDSSTWPSNRYERYKMYGRVFRNWIALIKEHDGRELRGASSYNFAEMLETARLRVQSEGYRSPRWETG